MQMATDDWNAIHKGISAVLKDMLSDEGDLLRGKSVLHAATGLSRARSAIDAALSHVLEGWNMAHCDPLLSLPPELVCQCFRQLGFRDRIVVSHVSRAWRVVGLADGRLWDEVAVQLRVPQVGAEMVAALLQRSDPLPFTFSWVPSEEVPLIPWDLTELITRHMHRMEFLRMDKNMSWTLQGLFRRAAPHLISLDFPSVGGPCVLPHNWGFSHAPVIKELRVGSFIFPRAFRPLASVQSFSGSWSSPGYRWQVPVNIFSYFPALHTLYLDDVTQDALEHLQNPPPTLDDVTLVARHDLLTYYAPFLFSCYGSHITRVKIHGAAEFSTTVQLFAFVVRGEWHMEISDKQVRLWSYAGDGEEEYIVNCMRRVSFAQDPRFTAHLACLRTMALPMGLLGELCAIAAWNRCLPCLHEIFLVFTARWNPDPPWTPAQPIDSPRLVCFTFVIKDSPNIVWNRCRWIRDSFPPLLPQLFKRARPRLASIVIDTGRDVNTNEDFASLRSIADDVRLRTGFEDHSLNDTRTP